MTPKRYRQAGQLYHDALALERDRRAAFLEGACGSDEELRLEVESLLASHERAGEFMAWTALAALPLDHPAPPSLVGRTIASYRVLAPIGAGGMGEVYLA